MYVYDGVAVLPHVAVPAGCRSHAAYACCRCVEPAWLLADALMPRCPATLRPTGDIVAPSAMRQYPPDACNTLYIEGLPGECRLLPAVLPLLSCWATAAALQLKTVAA